MSRHRSRRHARRSRPTTAKSPLRQNWFAEFAHESARISGKPATFLLALGLLIVWALAGPLFGYSDTWQLFINTTTTIITFLMVFLIQSTQNRDTLAIQAKLAELILHIRGIPHRLAAAEDMSDEELEALHQDYHRRAEETYKAVQQRKSRRK